jgi:hypothetical protein
MVVRIAFGHGFVRICQQPLQLLIDNPLVCMDQWKAKRTQSFLLRIPELRPHPIPSNNGTFFFLVHPFAELTSAM